VFLVPITFFLKLSQNKLKFVLTITHLLGIFKSFETVAQLRGFQQPFFNANNKL
ncbi:hypothetical protein Mgra_00008007, partial [Meloidogyne graminicola]